MSELTKEIGDICISCTVLPILGISAVTYIIYAVLSYFF